MLYNKIKKTKEILLKKKVLCSSRNIKHKIVRYFYIEVDVYYALKFLSNKLKKINGIIRLLSNTLQRLKLKNKLPSKAVIIDWDVEIKKLYKCQKLFISVQRKVIQDIKHTNKGLYFLLNGTWLKNKIMFNNNKKMYFNFIQKLKLNKKTDKEKKVKLNKKTDKEKKVKLNKKTDKQGDFINKLKLYFNKKAAKAKELALNKKVAKAKKLALNKKVAKAKELALNKKVAKPKQLNMSTKSNKVKRINKLEKYAYREYYIEWLSFWCKKIKVIKNYLKYINFRLNEKKSKYNLFLKGVLRVYYYVNINKFIFFNIKTLSYIVINLSSVQPKVYLYNEKIFKSNYSKYILGQKTSINKKFNLKKLKENLVSSYIDLKSYFLNYYKLMYLLFFWFLYFFDAHLLYLNYIIFSLWSRFLFLIFSSHLDYKYLSMLHKYSNLYKQLKKFETKSIDTHIYDSTVYYTYNRSSLDHNLLGYLFGDHIYNINKVSFNVSFSILNKNINTLGYIHSYFDIYKYNVVYLRSRYVNVEKNYIYSVTKRGIQLV